MKPSATALILIGAALAMVIGMGALLLAARRATAPATALFGGTDVAEAAAAGMGATWQVPGAGESTHPTSLGGTPVAPYSLVDLATEALAKGGELIASAWSGTAGATDKIATSLMTMDEFNATYKGYVEQADGSYLSPDGHTVVTAVPVDAAGRVVETSNTLRVSVRVV